MSTRESVIELLKGYSVTSFKGRKPTATDVDTLEKELAEIATTIESSLFEGGDEHGHLCCVIPNEAYGQLIDDEDFEFEAPEAPEPYNPEIDDITPPITTARSWRPSGRNARRTTNAIWECRRPYAT